MGEPGLRSTRFRDEREAQWRRLEGLLRRLETQPIRRLAEDELLAIPVLYRAALSSLSVARETSLDGALLTYLESLCTRAYFLIYGARPSLRSRVARFFRVDWPASARALWRETLVAAGLLVLGAVVAAWLCVQDPSWWYAFMPADGSGRDPDASTDTLRAVLYHSGGNDGLGAFAAFLFTHNAQITLFAFALGFAFGIPTAWLILTNGCTLGAIFTLYARHGLGVELGGWLMIHGVTELWACVLASAGGFRIGWSLAFPGERTRVEAAAAAGRQAATLMAGVLVMLFVAGVLEGLGRQLITLDALRYLIAAASAVVWAGYLYTPRRPR